MKAAQQIHAIPGVTGQGESTPSLVVPSPSWEGSLRANN
jgi:hypothetical protein